MNNSAASDPDCFWIFFAPLTFYINIIWLCKKILQSIWFQKKILPAVQFFFNADSLKSLYWIVRGIILRRKLTPQFEITYNNNPAVPINKKISDKSRNCRKLLFGRSKKQNNNLTESKIVGWNQSWVQWSKSLITISGVSQSKRGFGGTVIF